MFDHKNKFFDSHDSSSNPQLTTKVPGAKIDHLIPVKQDVGSEKPRSSKRGQKMYSSSQTGTNSAQSFTTGTNGATKRRLLSADEPLSEGGAGQGGDTIAVGDLKGDATGKMLV